MMKSQLFRPLLLSGLVFLAALAVGGYLTLLDRDGWLDERRQEATGQLVRLVSVIEDRIGRALAVAESMESYIRRHHGGVEDFESHAADLLGSVGAVSAIELAPDGVIRHIYPLAGRRAMLGQRVVESRYASAAAYRAMLEERLVLSPPLVLDNGQVAVIGRKPVYLSDADGDTLFWGFASVLLELQHLVRDAGLERLGEGGYRYQLVIDEARPSAGDPQPFASGQFVEAGIRVPDGAWVLRLAPLQPWGLPPRFYLQLLVVLFVSGLLAYLEFILLWQPVALRREVRRASAALQRANARYEAVFDSVREVLFQLDTRGQITLVNPAWKQVTGHDPVDSLGHPFETFVHPDDRAMVRQLLGVGLENHALAKDVELRLLGRGQDVRWVEMTLQTVDSAHGASGGLSGTLHDISERKKADDIIQYHANYDTLTNLPNRKLFQDRFGRALESTLRKGQRLALMFIDLDRFKWINDTIGHAAGDALLREVAMRLTACVRKADTVARFGGDEFVVLLTEIGSAIDAEIVARKILAELARPFDLEGRKESISGSVGITLCPDDGRDIATLMSNADNVMYLVKEDGRNGFKFFTAEMNDALEARHELSAKLREAIDRDLLELVFQPVIELGRHDPVGVEALLRWTDEDCGRVPPREVIALAEDTQLIDELGGWILDHACAEFIRLRAVDPRLDYVAINVSTRQFRHGIHALVVRTLDRYGLEPGMLALDLTESLIVDDRPEVWEGLERLRALGVRLMLDDFGTGITSLGHLKRLAPEAVKLQGDYLAGIVPATSAAAMIGAMIAMAHSLGIRVVGEGVEQAQQAEMLEALGCDFAQGYHFSPPLSCDELIAQLHHGTETGSAGTA